VGTDYILKMLPDVSGPSLVEAGRYTEARLFMLGHGNDDEGLDHSCQLNGENRFSFQRMIGHRRD